MNYLRNKYFLMDTAGGDASGGAGAGGSGTGSLLTTPPGGGGPPAAQGGGGNPPGAGVGGATGANGGGANATNTGGAPNNWRSQLPAELQAEPSLQIFTDVPSLAKSFIHAQRAVGADKIAIPGKHATDEDWKQVYEKLGVPKELKDYALKLPETASLDKAFSEKFKETAFKAGILPAQAQKLADWFAETNKGAEAEITKQRTAQATADLAALKTEWGVAYDQKLNRAAQVIKEAGSPELIKYLDDSGLGNDVRLIKLLSGVADKFMKEDTPVGGAAGFKPKFSPVEARAEANKIIGDFSHPYHSPDHPNHKAAVKEVADLFNMASGLSAS